MRPPHSTGGAYVNVLCVCCEGAHARKRQALGQEQRRVCVVCGNVCARGYRFRPRFGSSYTTMTTTTTARNTTKRDKRHAVRRRVRQPKDDKMSPLLLLPWHRTYHAYRDESTPLPMPAHKNTNRRRRLVVRLSSRTSKSNECLRRPDKLTLFTQCAIGANQNSTTVQCVGVLFCATLHAVFGPTHTLSVVCVGDIALFACCKAAQELTSKLAQKHTRKTTTTTRHL